MSNRRSAAVLLLLAVIAAAALPALLPEAEGLDVDTRQVLIEARLVSTSIRTDMEFGIDWSNRKARLTPEQSSDLLGQAQDAKLADEQFLDMLAADSALSGTEQGNTIRDLTMGSLFQNDIFIDVLLNSTEPQVRLLSRPRLTAMNHDTATISVLQDRHRFPDGKKGLKEAGRFRDLLTELFPSLAALGLPTDQGVIFEPFDGKPRKTLLERSGFSVVDPLKVKVGKGALTLSGTGKEPAPGFLRFMPEIRGDYTLLLTVQLPKKVSKKGREALQGVTSVLEVDSDTDQPPSEFVLIGNQFTLEGFAQSFTATKGGVQDVIPHPTLSTTRTVTNVIVKDGTSLVLGGIFREENGETSSWSREIPVLGDLPFIGVGLLGATKKTKVEQRDLLIFLTPHIVTLPD
jgi:hypothetical protein